VTARTQALDGLRRMISSGELSPGQRFPPEAELCARLDVSRSSLREAVRVLDTLGVLEVRHGAGTFVSRLDPGDVVRGFSLTVDLLPLDGLLQLFEVRRVLEQNAASQAAARADDAVVARLQELAERMESSDDAEETTRLDDEFHELILGAAGNTTAATLVQVFRSRGRHYRIFESVSREEVKQSSDAGHRAIVDGIRRRDPAAAGAAAAAHVATTEQWLRDLHPDPE
jgi:GntR family transcriptional regulator, transcriptional repressor for pyruvate dehydrogenase complex